MVQSTVSIHTYRYGTVQYARTASDFIFSKCRASSNHRIKSFVLKGMFKLAALISLILSSAVAFSPVRIHHSRVLSLVSEKINSKIEVGTSPKVVTNLELKAGEKKVFCRCWKSGTFPLCDASHAKHNEVRLARNLHLVVACSITIFTSRAGDGRQRGTAHRISSQAFSVI